jgi:hypothetical protein
LYWLSLRVTPCTPWLNESQPGEVKYGEGEKKRWGEKERGRRGEGEKRRRGEKERGRIK